MAKKNKVSYVKKIPFAINSTLKNIEEVYRSTNLLINAKLIRHQDIYKNWDLVNTLGFMLKNVEKTGKVLELGCYSSPMLPNLRKLGYQHLYGIDLNLTRHYRERTNSWHGVHIKYSKQNLENTDFQNEFFDCVISMSVIEHGVNVDLYFKEASRLLKNGGFLLTTTDYWKLPIKAASNIFPYGKKRGAMKIFTKEEIDGMIRQSEKYGFVCLRPFVKYTVGKPLIKWLLPRKSYTFIQFTLKKDDGNK